MANLTGTTLGDKTAQANTNINTQLTFFKTGPTSLIVRHFNKPAQQQQLKRPNLCLSTGHLDSRLSQLGLGLIVSSGVELVHLGMCLFPQPLSILLLDSTQTHRLLSSSCLGRRHCSIFPCYSTARLQDAGPGAANLITMKTAPPTLPPPSLSCLTAGRPIWMVSFMRSQAAPAVAMVLCQGCMTVSHQEGRLVASSQEARACTAQQAPRSAVAARQAYQSCCRWTGTGWGAKDPA